MTSPDMQSESLYESLLEGGKHWSLTVRADHVLRLTDLRGGANVGMLFYNPLNVLERYNMPDTLKCQHTFRLTKGHCLYSDMGRIFCSIIEDTVGWHDTVCGTCNGSLVAQKWAGKSYQKYRNDWTQNGFDSFLIEGAKYGLGERDLTANVNWFSKVSADDAGDTVFDAGNSHAGAFVDLRFEMDTLVLLHTCPHPLSTAAEYPHGAVRLRICKGAPAQQGDPCRRYCPENERGFANTILYRQCACSATGA
jgi:urea carboxylase-associated protein 2